MSIYLINAHADVEKTVPLEQKICGLLPNVVKAKNLEAITREISRGESELIHVIFLAPSNDATYVDLLVRAAENYRQRIFFILVCDEISGSDYKRLMRSGGADWVSASAPAQEILDIPNVAIGHNRQRKSLPHLSNGGPVDRRRIALHSSPRMNRQPRSAALGRH